MTDKHERFARLKAAAERDPNIVAFWLGGSRGKGLATERSDYDCTLLVEPEALDDYRAKYARLGQMDTDVLVMTLDQFRHHAAWGGPEAWDRYSCAGLTPLIDRTGEVQALFDAKGRVPAAAVRAWIEASLDGFVNQVYRAIKCRRDGRFVGARLEAAEAVPPLLNALFALNGGRLRPYHKYLERELAAHPLDKLPWDPETFLALLLEVLSAAEIAVLQSLLRETERLFRAEGYGPVFDAWGKGVPWMLAFDPAAEADSP